MPAAGGSTIGETQAAVHEQLYRLRMRAEHGYNLCAPNVLVAPKYYYSTGIMVYVICWQLKVSLKSPGIWMGLNDSSHWSDAHCLYVQKKT